MRVVTPMVSPARGPVRMRCPSQRRPSRQAAYTIVTSTASGCCSSWPSASMRRPRFSATSSVGRSTIAKTSIASPTHIGTSPASACSAIAARTVWAMNPSGSTLPVGAMAYTVTLS